MINNNKTCNKCGVSHPKDFFFKSGKYPSGKFKIRGECKLCSSISTTNWRIKNRSRYNNYVAMWRAKNPDRQHKTEIKRNYGLSIEEYNAMLLSQKMMCAICSKQHDPSIKRGRLYVDHCHKTKRVRALLCSACNSMIGYANDSIETLQKAMSYLSSY